MNKHSLAVLFVVAFFSSIGCTTKYTEEEWNKLKENKEIVTLKEENAKLRGELVASQAETLDAKKEVFDLKTAISDFKIEIAGLKKEVALKNELLTKIDVREASLTAREKDISTKAEILATAKGGFAERERKLNEKKDQQNAREKRYKEVVIAREAEFNEKANSVLSSIQDSINKLGTEQDKLIRLRRSNSSFALGPAMNQERLVSSTRDDLKSKLKELITLFKERRSVLETFP